MSPSSATEHGSLHVGFIGSGMMATVSERELVAMPVDYLYLLLILLTVLYCTVLLQAIMVRVANE